MGYPVIRETKFVILPDGRYLHLSLQGCNNDTAGRARDEFVGALYTAQKLEYHIEDYENCEIPQNGGFELQIGNRKCFYKDYGKHLRTMMRRAVKWETLQETNGCYAIVAEACVTDTHGKILRSLSEAEFDAHSPYMYNMRMSGFYIDAQGVEHPDKRLYIKRNRINDINTIVQKLDAGVLLEFYVGHRKKH